MTSPSKEYYEKTRGFATTKGQTFEVKVAALFFLRGLNTNLDFQLASNAKGAGALDDIVLKTRDVKTRDDPDDGWKSYFVQLKTETSKMITLTKLTNPENKYKNKRNIKKDKVKFALPRYCDSYKGIKVAMSKKQGLFDGDIKDSFFVIFTNAEPYRDLGKEHQGREPVNEFLGNSGKVFKFDPNGTTHAEVKISEALNNCTDWQEFMKRLLIFSSQPIGRELDDLLKVELRKAVGKENKNIDVDRLLTYFVENVNVWSENKNNVLSRGSDLFASARDRVLAETVSLHEVEANKLDLVFEEAAVSPLRAVLGADSPVVVVRSSEPSARLTCTKLLQAFDSSAYLFLGSERFLANQKAVIAEWGRGTRNTLIVSVNNRDAATDKTHFEKILELCKTAVSPKKSLVILGDDKIEIKNCSKYLEDTFEFLDLTLKFRDKVLDSEFKFQGCLISWRNCDDDFRVLSASCVVEIMKTGSELSVGNALPEPVEYYLPRSLKPAKDDDSNESSCLSPKTVMDVQEREVIVCGEPGMGKSTLMKHLAKTTKGDHPRLWVMLIKLNDHIELFAEGKHKDATGFLLEAAKIESPIERLMFTLDLEVIGNVVVMLDGFDEVVPRYVDQCYQLLSNLRKTKARKIWVTTRISVKYKLNSYMQGSTTTRLCAFSEDDQRNCLKKYWKFLASKLGKEIPPEGELEVFISRLLEMISRSIGDWKTDFPGNPLHIKMIADVFFDYVIDQGLTLPETLDLLQLLEKFVQQKFKLFVQERLKIKSHDTNYDSVKEVMRIQYVNDHMKAALFVILYENLVDLLLSKEEIDGVKKFLDRIASGEDKTGFITGISSYGKAQFVHRVFAEYFVALWFAGHLPEYAKAMYNYGPVIIFSGDSRVTILLCDLILAKDRPLLIAVLNKDVDKVKTLLEAGADVNATDRAGRTALHLNAYFYGEENEIFDLLLKAERIDVNIKDTELLKGTPLQYAQVRRNWAAMDKLLAHNADPACLETVEPDFQDYDSIVECLMDEDLATLFKFYLDKFPDTFVNLRPYTADSDDESEGTDICLLADASRHGCPGIVKMLLAKNYDVNGQQDDHPPLHCAAEEGYLDIVELLVEAASDTLSPPKFVNRKNSDGRTALHTASLRGGEEVVSFLIANRADVTVDNDGDTCLHLAAENRLGVIRVVINALGKNVDRNAFVNRKNSDGRTALHTALLRGEKEVVSFLIANRADVTVQDNDGDTCLHLAAENWLDVIEVVINAVSEEERPAFVNLRNNRECTALHIAAWAGHVEAVAALVCVGADMSFDIDGDTPLTVAATKGHLAVVLYLVQAFNITDIIVGYPSIDSHGKLPVWADMSRTESGLTLRADLPFPEQQRAETSWEGLVPLVLEVIPAYMRLANQIM